MIIRRYEARNLQDALAEVKRDLGPEAVILSSRRIPRWEALKAAIWNVPMEVVAAVPPDGNGSEQEQPSQSSQDPKREAAVRNNRSPGSSDESYQSRKLLSLLKAAGVDEAIGRRILNRLFDGAGEGVEWDDETLVPRLAGALMRWIPTSGPVRLTPGMPRVVTFVGPTGSGKTTNLVKLASRYALKDPSQVVLVAMDTFKLGAVEQLASYGQLLGVPVVVAHDARALIEVVDRYRYASFIGVDTPGRGPGDKHHAAQNLRGVLRRLPSVEVHLVMSATTRDQEMVAIARSFYELPFHRVLFTKVDEGVVLGPMLNLAWKVNCPISYVSTGQRIPEDLEVATPERITDLILRMQL